jgi:hydroxyacylglutathione hydrolase
LQKYRRFADYFLQKTSSTFSVQTTMESTPQSAPQLSVYPVESGPVATFGYMITDTAKGENAKGVAAVIDVPMESTEYFLEIAEQENVTIESIFLTHSHWDHTGDAAKLQRATGAKIYIHPDDEYRMGEPNKYTSIPLPFTIEPCAADGGYFRHGDIISCGAWHLEVRHTPGHTEGGVCFIDHAQRIAFVGDTIFAGSVGRTDMEGGNTEQLLESIRTQLFTLDDTFVALPGHGSHTNIGIERRTNPFLQ